VTGREQRRDCQQAKQVPGRESGRTPSIVCHTLH
jgi:hypothetical protein